MLSEHQAPEIHFAGLGSNAATAAEAAAQLAAALRQWCVGRDGCRVLQLSVLPAVPAPGVSAAGSSFGAMAIVAYVDGALSSESAAEAVAAAVEEIHDAQLVGGEPGGSSPPASEMLPGSTTTVDGETSSSDT